MKYYVGIDLGGTNIVAGVVNEAYSIVASAKCKTNCPRPAEEIISDMAKVAVEAVDKAGITMEEVEWIVSDLPVWQIPKRELSCMQTIWIFTMFRCVICWKKNYIKRYISATMPMLRHTANLWLAPQKDLRVPLRLRLVPVSAAVLLLTLKSIPGLILQVRN